MSFAQSLIPEFDQEMATTRRVLERVPSECAQWKPHEKSFAMGHLAQLVAGMPFWLPPMIKDNHIDLAKFGGYTVETTPTLLAQFDAGVKAARATLEHAGDVDFDAPWSLMHGSTVLFTLPRRAVVRTHINHMVHHRGQLTVYLRLQNVPVPPIYGPTADEATFG